MTWRVYVYDWVVSYSSDQPAEAGHAECLTVFGERWEGRVADDDVRYEKRGSGWSILLRLPERQGEFTDKLLAVQFATGISCERGLPHVAEAGSRVERDLLDYGKRKLQA